jgi:hypothetical protein
VAPPNRLCPATAKSSAKVGHRFAEFLAIRAG